MFEVSYKIEILLSIVVIVFAMVLIQFFKRGLKRFMVKKGIDINRRKIILNLIYLAFYIICITILTLIWGIKMREFIVFISSVLAVLGVGFFAQWSILSNLTASVILFFNHPLRIGDRIRIMDKDFDFTGKVTDLTGFYLFMTTDKGEHISIPNSILLQKTIEIFEVDIQEQLSDKT